MSIKRSKTDTKYGLYSDISKTRTKREFIKRRKNYIAFIDGKKIKISSESISKIAEHYNLKNDEARRNICITEEPNFKADKII